MYYPEQMKSLSFENFIFPEPYICELILLTMAILNESMNKSRTFSTKISVKVVELSSLFVSKRLDIILPNGFSNSREYFREIWLEDLKSFKTEKSKLEFSFSLFQEAMILNNEFTARSIKISKLFFLPGRLYIKIKNSSETCKNCGVKFRK